MKLYTVIAVANHLPLKFKLVSFIASIFDHALHKMLEVPSRKSAQ